MHDDSVLVAIDAALRFPAFCACGNNLSIAMHDDAAWLECASLTEPSRLPAPIAGLVRAILHDRRFVIDVRAVTGSDALRPAAQPVTTGRARAGSSGRPG